METSDWEKIKAIQEEGKRREEKNRIRVAERGTNERLSRLQKWILIQAHKGTYAIGDFTHRYDITKRAIYEHYFKVKIDEEFSSNSKFKSTEPLGNRPVILSRSIRRLKEQGYIESEPEWFTRDQWGLCLTNDGHKRAEEILKKEPCLFL